MTSRILILILGLFLFANCSPLLVDAPHISDEKLINNFQENKADFELLVQMAKQDSNLVRIADNFTWTKESAAFPRPESELGISNKRWEEYKSLFKTLKLEAGILNYQPNSVYFTSSTQGLLTGGSSKGYAYLQKKPETLVDSLDNFKLDYSNKNGSFVYKKLEGNWYMYYEVSD